MSPALAGGFLTTAPPGKSQEFYFTFYFLFLFFGHAAQHVGILVPRPGIEPVPPEVEVRSLNQWTAREVSQESYLFIYLFIYFKIFIYLFVCARS